MKKICVQYRLIFREYSCFCPDSTFAQEILTLEKALEIAYQQSPSIIQSKMSLEQSELALIQQKASLKSQFSLNFEPVSIYQKYIVRRLQYTMVYPESHEFRP